MCYYVIVDHLLVEEAERYKIDEKERGKVRKRGFDTGKRIRE